MFGKLLVKVFLAAMLLFAVTVSPVGAQIARAQSNCKDNYEPNDNWDKATQLSPGQYESYICTKGDDDWFTVTVNAGNNVVTLSNLPADYDFYVYSVNQGKWIGQSENDGQNEERFRWNSKKGETIYILVAAYDSTISSLKPYVLTVGRFPDFWLPINGLGEGVNTSIGSPYHTGPDFYALDYISKNYWDATYEGMSIYPTLPGQVVYSGLTPGKGYGCVVVVRTWDDQKWDKKIYTLYAHLQADSRNNCLDLPIVGKLVGSEPIGHLGKSGQQEQVHLHFAVRYSDQVFDGTNALWGAKTPAFDPRGLFK
jgi:murein DD-endopeptidase MepM/ murein hydrolase activator NlpD